MNAIIGLCHFCEAHGPRPVFCTFTTEDENVTTEPTSSSTQCTGCRSLGPETVLMTKDDDGTVYCSRESVPNADVSMFLRQAAVRSITCEVSWSKDGGVVYFSDVRGHILSLTFQVKDTRARGLKRWFSIVVLMKDKMLLLNLTTLLSEHMQKIAKEIQEFAEIVYNKEQQVCSQRSLRLNTGCNYFGQSRSLVQLTGEDEIFKRLHSHFTCMMKAGSLAYTEKLYTSNDVLNNLSSNSNKSTTVFTPNICYVENNEEVISLRDLESLLGKTVFRTVLYCTLCGVDIRVISTKTPSINILKALSRVLPIPNEETAPNIRMNEDGSAVNGENKCIVAESDNEFSCQWSGTLPSKCPTLMNRIESGMSNPKFDDAVLKQYVKGVVLEWLGIARTIISAIDASGERSEAIVKLKQVFGITIHDEKLISYWIRAFCIPK